MRITYLIGNGFDLAMGLKTSYMDFIQEYIKKQNHVPCVKYFKKHIERNLETWSSAEEALGKHTEKYKTFNYSDFCKCYDDFIKELSHYFVEQDSQCKKPKSRKTYNAFQGALFKLSTLSFHPENTALTAALSDQLEEDRYFCFFNFNYTRVFDRCLHNYSTPEKAYTLRTVNENLFGDTVGPVYHIHGTFDELMIMGVNDERQIENSALASFRDIRNRMIKPEINGALNERRFVKFREEIDRSDIIILFGMSIGPTDRTWWTQIGKWLTTDEKHQLVIFIYRPEIDGVNCGPCLDSAKETQNRFLQNTEIPKDDYKMIRPRIQIIFNHPLFGSRLYDPDPPQTK